jgi:lipoic acid synthetase
LPPWLKRRLPAGGHAAAVRRLLGDLHLATVCDGAACPNISECYARGTATFLILGRTCTRACRFCAIPNDRNPAPPREDEPEAVAQAARRMQLRHVVITSVTRDDLPDGGAGHFAATIRAVRQELPQAVIEVLTPDFQGGTPALDAVLEAGPDIFNHNVETVPRLYPAIRPQADYRRSLRVLEYAGTKNPADSACGMAADGGSHDSQARRGSRLYTKSGMMAGLGETADEVIQVMRDLRAVGCDILTIGQYLAPSPDHAPVARFVEPGEFDAWKALAEQLGFISVASGPFVRSSYNAAELFERRTSK